MALTLSRSERLPSGVHGPNVGPGAYDIKPTIGGATGTGAPFLSMQDRGSGVAKGAVPGPGE